MEKRFMHALTAYNDVMSRDVDKGSRDAASCNAYYSCFLTRSVVWFGMFKGFFILSVSARRSSVYITRSDDVMENPKSVASLGEVHGIKKL